MKSIDSSVNQLVDLIKNCGVELYQEEFIELDKIVQDFILKWLNDNDWIPGVPFEHLGLDTCTTAWFERKTKVFVFSLYYDGSDTGTDPCGGNLVFSYDSTEVKLLLNMVECGD